MEIKTNKEIIKILLILLKLKYYFIIKPLFLLFKIIKIIIFNKNN